MMHAEGIKILLVDDVHLVLNRLKLLLSGLKHVSQAETADSAEKAIQLMDHFEPDVLVLDINMPGMSGIEMLDYIQKKCIKRPVIIMLTNHTFSFYREECLRLGADYFLDKSRDFLLIPSIIKSVQEKMVFK